MGSFIFMKVVVVLYCSNSDRERSDGVAIQAEWGAFWACLEKEEEEEEGRYCHVTND